MPRAQLTDEQIQNESEKLFLEQAKAFYRDFRHAVHNAPPGKAIHHGELFGLKQGRAFLAERMGNSSSATPPIRVLLLRR